MKNFIRLHSGMYVNVNSITKMYINNKSKYIICVHNTERYEVPERIFKSAYNKCKDYLDEIEKEKAHDNI